MKNYIKYPLILGSTFTVGTIFGVLIAPDKGKNTCRKIISSFDCSNKKEIDDYLENRIDAIGEEINVIKEDDVDKKVYAHINKRLNSLLRLCRKYKKDKYEEKIYFLKKKVDNCTN